MGFLNPRFGRRLILKQDMRNALRAGCDEHFPEGRFIALEMNKRQRLVNRSKRDKIRWSGFVLHFFIPSRHDSKIRRVKPARACTYTRALPKLRHDRN